MDYLIRLQRLDLDSLSCAVSIVVNDSKSLYFASCSLIRIASSTIPGSLSLVYGFTHDESVPYLFSTLQATSQQQTQNSYPIVEETRPSK